MFCGAAADRNGKRISMKADEQLWAPRVLITVHLDYTTAKICLSLMVISCSMRAI